VFLEGSFGIQGPENMSRDKGKDDLHGNAPSRSRAVLLLVDVINDLKFPNNEKLVRECAELGRRIAALKRRCKKAGIPTIYVNDNHGIWRSDFAEVLRKCLRRNAPGRPMVKRLAPESRDYLVLKPKHSAFYGTPLGVLLEYIGADTVIVGGVTTNACVMITVSDLYVRDFRVLVPSDCVAALSDEEQGDALKLMEANYGAETTASEKLDLRRLLKKGS
jgi:nicotinamidase-related amidase